MAIGNATAADFARMDECNTTPKSRPRWKPSISGTPRCTMHRAGGNGFITGITGVFRLMTEVRWQDGEA